MIQKFAVYTKNSKENMKHNILVINHNYIIEITGTKNSLLSVLETLQLHDVALNKNLISMTSTEDYDTFILKFVADSINDLNILFEWVSDNIDDEVDIDGEIV